MMGVMPINESAAIGRARDKLRCLQVLSREGIDLPKTGFAHAPDDIQDVIRHVGGPPLVVKLLEGTQGLGVVLADNKKAASSVIEAFNGLKARVIVQEFIKEANGADIRAIVINGEVVGAMKRTAKEGEFRSNLHRGGSAEVIKLKRTEKAAAVKAAKALGLTVAGVDMLESARGPLILEVNSSPGLEGIEKATGIDIAAKIIEFVEQRPERKRVQKDRVNA